VPELLRMPEVAAGSQSATLSQWLFGEGQPYEPADSLATIETDKATVDLSSETAGVLVRILVTAGSEVVVGDPVALIAQPGEVIEDVDAALAALSVFLPSKDATGELPPVPPAKPVAALATDEQPDSSLGGDRFYISPLARRLAEDARLSLTSLSGTGPHGRVVRADVERAVKERNAVPHDVTSDLVGRADSGRTPSTSIETASSTRGAGPYAGATVVPISRARRAMAARLSESKRSTPHFYLRGTAEVDGLLEVRARLNEASPEKISLNDLILKAAARAHQLVPAMNVVWAEDSILAMSTVDLGMAMATPRGLVTPVLRSVEGMSINVLATTTRDLAERGRAGRLGQHELEGGSLTVTNLGMYGTEEFAAIINPPQSAILAVGAVRREPVVTDEGTVEARSVIRVTLSVDHRPIDGAVAAEWMRAFLSLVDDPIQILV
jgi:pyruvate dehydrogenase E2 component (dihydrolipoamide acetyltransferase)